MQVPVTSTWLLVLLTFSIADLLPSCPVCYCKWVIHAATITVERLFLPPSLSVLVHVFWCSVVRSMYVYKCYSSLMDYRF